MREPVHVVCAANSAYNRPLCVMLASVAANFDPARDLVIHVISNDSSEQDREKVRRSVDPNRPSSAVTEIRWYSLSNPALDKFFVIPGGHYTRDIYARLFIPDLLPETCKRIVYLDCDMVALRDISTIYDEADSNDRLLQAVHHVRIDTVSKKHGGVFDYKDRGLPPNTRYFSSGVLVIDLKRWRERDLTRKLVAYLVEYGARVFTDQAALNAFLALDWSPLDPRWNQTSDVLFPKFWTAAGYPIEQWKQVRNHPFIVHFSGPKKPWQKRHTAPRYSYFYEYLAKTPYRDSIPQRPHLEDFLGRRNYYQLWRVARNAWTLKRSLDLSA